MVFSTADFGAVLDAVRHFKPTLLLQGLSKSAQVGLNLIVQARHASPQTRIVVVTQWSDSKVAIEALRRGAAGFIPLTSTVPELLDGLRAVVAGSTYVPQELSGRMMSSLALGNPDAKPLSDRQVEIVRLLARGKSLKEVAWELKMTTRTVAFHKYNAMRRLNIKTSAELVRYALEHHLL